MSEPSLTPRQVRAALARQCLIHSGRKEVLAHCAYLIDQLFALETSQMSAQQRARLKLEMLRNVEAIEAQLVFDPQ